MTNLKSSVPSWNALTHIESLREQVLIISRLKTRFCNLINKLQSRISYQVRPIVDKSTQPLLSIFKRRHKIKQRLVFCARFSHNLAIVNFDENMAYLHWKPVVECCSKGGDVQASGTYFGFSTVVLRFTGIANLPPRLVHFKLALVLTIKLILHSLESVQRENRIFTFPQTSYRTSSFKTIL